MKLQGQNLATFSHSAVTPIAYLQHTVNTNKTCVNNALINAVNNAIKKINRLTALVHTIVSCYHEVRLAVSTNGIESQCCVRVQVLSWFSRRVR